ncbi:hypothetical protein BGX34_009514 [Mortierella sp. NVP85]|nr:hypothetical protein BGX34_009514 [Mortierella sp. NVP85]
MGLVGVNGKITSQSFNKGCLLYMSMDGDVMDYDNGYCLFPIIGAAVLAFTSLIFLMYWFLALKRRDEFVPRPVSFSFILLSFLCTLLAFAICGEIGIGLNRGCKVLGAQRDRCRKTNNFKALWVAEIFAGIIGGLWLIATLLELFQLKRRPPRLLGPATSSVDRFSQTTVVPHRSNTTTSHTATGNGPQPTLGGATPRAQKSEYTQPEMTQHQGQDSYVP